MALEAVVFAQDPFTYNSKDLYFSGGVNGAWSHGFDFQEQEHKSLDGMFLDNNAEQGLNSNWDSSSSSIAQNVKEWDSNSSPEAFSGERFLSGEFQSPAPVATFGRRKRRRAKACKNKEEVENQRMTHIAVERNRRKMMNDYLGVLRSLMPASYVQRGDQASIIGGAINFVKELEQVQQSLETQKRKQNPNYNGSSPPFADFFTFPQYTTRSTRCRDSGAGIESMMPEKQTGVADIEVTMVETHANLKILSERRPKQLLKMVAGFHSLRLSILHLNVTTDDQMVLYSISVKIEEDCQLNSVDDIAAAVNEMLRRIQEEAVLC